MLHVCMRFRKFLHAALSALLFCVFCAAIYPQSVQQPPDASSQPLVKLNISVLDNSKRTVTDVKQDELHVLEDGVEQKIVLFERDERPLSYGLVVDSSGSLRSQFRQVIEAAHKFINSNRAEDEGFAMRFISRDKIDVLHDFTSDKNALLNSLNVLKPEGGQTAFVDAVYLAATKMAQRKQIAGGDARHRVLILITDGEDRDSFYKKDKLFDLLRESDVQIFALGLVEELDDENKGLVFSVKSRTRATELLDRLTKETGGRVYYPRTPDEVLKAVDEIAQDLRAQYLIGYSPAPNKKSKSYRKLKISLAAQKQSGRQVIARTGYAVKDK